MTRDGALSAAPFSIFPPSFFFGLPRRLSIRLLLSFVVLFDRRLFQETRSLDPTRPVTFVTMFKAWSDKVVRKRRFKR